MAQSPVATSQQGAQQPINNGPSFPTTSLYVGDLDFNVTEAQLYEIFSQVGPVVSIRVCRDLITRRSLGYAYVNYNSSQDAARSLDLLNFTNINGKPIRIMMSHRDPSLRKSGTANIFIKNLDKGIDNKALHDTFSAFGSIMSCKVATDASGQSKGYGFVQFESEESAQTAIDKVNGMLLNEKQVFVGPFVKRQERMQSSSGQKFNNVFVKNLSEKTTDEDLLNAFSAYGPITSAVVMKDADGKSRGFGFVNFEDSDDAARACDGLNGRLVDEKEWYVGRAQKKTEREAELRNKIEADRKERIEKYQGVNLYMKNLDDSVDDEKLRELFAEFGTVTSCKVMRDPAGESKGAGFVAFSSPEEATKAVAEMNGKLVGSKPLYVALAQKKEERRARLQAQFNSRNMQMGINASNGPASLPMYPQNMNQQIFYGQPPQGLMPPPQTAGFPYQQQMLGGVRPGMGQMSNYFVPMGQRQNQPNQRNMGRRNGPPQQQQQQQRQNRGFRYSSNARNLPEGGPAGHPHMPMEMGSVPSEISAAQISTLATALTMATPEQQRAMLGEQLYPLVDQIEHEHAGKVTGMLLEMDQTEVLHLLESPEALRSKVKEAMDVLRLAAMNTSADQLAGLSLNDPQAV